MDNPGPATEPKFFRDFFRWLQNIYGWLGQALTAWDTLTGIFFALVIPSFIGVPSETLRFTGLVLQFVGTAFVIRDINGTRELFGKPSLLASGTQWLKSFPSFRPRPVTISMEASLPGLSATGRGFTEAKFDSSASLADRILLLERVAANLQNVDRQIYERIDEVKRELDQGIAEERQARIKGIDNARRLLEKAQTDDLHISALGTVWLLVGMVISTIPNEIAILYR